MSKLVSQNAIILGSLNPAIIQPNWMTKIGLIESGTKFKLNYRIGDVVSNSFICAPFKWQVDYKMLKVEIDPASDTELLNHFVSKVFGELSHTPVIAIGQNFLFELETNPLKHPNIKKDEEWEIGYKTKWGAISGKTNEFTLVVDDLRVIKINLIDDEKNNKVNINFHSDVTSIQQLTKFSSLIKDNLIKAKEIIKD